MGTVSGVAIAELAAGLVLAWSGIQNVPMQKVLQGFLHGQLPKGSAVTYATPASLSASATAPSGPSLPQSAAEKAVIVAILAGLAAPPTPSNVNSMAAWIRREAPWNASPPDGAEYTHNPMNTTLSAGSSGSINSVGVKIYPSWAAGISATVATLSGYPNIVAAFRSGKGLCGNSSVAGELSKWSGGGYTSVC